MSTTALGIDLGSSSVKVSLLDLRTAKALAHAQSPTDHELAMRAPQPGWAEQDPEVWWEHTVLALRALSARSPLGGVAAIGIGYQMHGLVLLDAAGEPVRPSIIWCDSRAVETGRGAAERLGPEILRRHTLNSPGNFTASKWGWVAGHEPDVLAKATTAMLPGDYIAFRLTGQRATTASGLSEMVLWDFAERRTATAVLDALGLDGGLLPPLVPTFGEQGQIARSVAERLGLPPTAKVSYRAGDQPNNALSLKVLEPGETATTAGTSGVVYAVSGERHFDERQRVNTFAHVNDTAGAERLGILLCVNGTGSAYAWLRRTLGAGGRPPGYAELNAWSDAVAEAQSDLRFYPFGNGAERYLQNRAPGARLEGLQFLHHGAPQLTAAVQDGIAAALAHGTLALGELGAAPRVLRAGRANLFLSDRFCQAFSQLTGAPLELFSTDGAQGAARGAAYGAGLYDSLDTALAGIESLGHFEPQPKLAGAYGDFFSAWKAGLA